MFDQMIFKEALDATSLHRGSKEQIADKRNIIEQLANNDDLIQMWGKYRKKFSYASDIEYANIIKFLKRLI